MTLRTHRRRRFPAALVVSIVLLSVPAASSAAFESGSYERVPRKLCPIDWRQGRFQVKKLIRCAEARWAVPGGASKALSIANRESNFRPTAYNSYSGAAGIYQHLRRYWPGRATDYGFKGRSAFNGRANIMVTMRMVHRGGWHPWDG